MQNLSVRICCHQVSMSCEDMSSEMFTINMYINMENTDPNLNVSWNSSYLIVHFFVVVVRLRIPQVGLRPTHRRNHIVQAGVDLLTIINNGNELPASPMVRRFRNAPRSPPYVLGRRRRSRSPSPDVPTQRRRLNWISSCERKQSEKNYNIT